MSKTILIADSSQNNRKDIAKYITDKGFRSMEAHNETEVLKILEYQPEIIMILLNDNICSNGAKTLFVDTLKDHIRFKTIPIIIITKEPSEEIQKLAKELKILAWILEPIKKEQIVNILEHFVI